MESKVEKFQSPGKGNGLWATSAASPGDLLYVAEPFAYAVNEIGRGHVCENCLCSPDHLLQCARCMFAKYCSKRCQTQAWPDHKRECKCLQSFPSKEDVDPIRLVAKMIIKILGQTSPCPSEELYSVSELESNYEHASDTYKSKLGSLAEMLQSYLKGSIPHPAQALAGFNLPELLAKVNCNHFLIYSPDMVTAAAGLYPGMSLLNHSCDPNCAVTFNGWQLHLRAIGAIYIGDELTTTYVDPLMATAERQSQLRHRYSFDCDCRRCLTRDQDEKMLAGDEQASAETKTMAMIVLELQKQSKWEQMLVLCRAQLRSNAGRVPDENIYQLSILDYAAEACRALSMWEEALQFGSRTLEPYRLYTSPFSPYRFGPMVKVGSLQLEQGKYRAARRTLAEALGIMKVSHGMAHPMTQKVLKFLAFCKIHLNLNRSDNGTKARRQNMF